MVLLRDWKTLLFVYVWGGWWRRGDEDGYMVHVCPGVPSVDSDVEGAVNQVKTLHLTTESVATTVSDNMSVCG